MKIIKIEPYENGAHANQTFFANVPVPDGYAFVPAGMVCENFPFGNITVEEIDGVMTVTKWEPLPIPEDPEEPVEPESEDVTWDAMAEAITEGVNAV